MAEASDTRRVEIGFGGGQVASIRLPTDEISALRKALSSPEGWYEVGSEDADLVLDLRQVVFLKVEGDPHSIGFAGDR